MRDIWTKTSRYNSLITTFTIAH